MQQLSREQLWKREQVLRSFFAKLEACRAMSRRMEDVLQACYGELETCREKQRHREGALRATFGQLEFFRGGPGDVARLFRGIGALPGEVAGAG